MKVRFLIHEQQTVCQTTRNTESKTTKTVRKWSAKAALLDVESRLCTTDQVVMAAQAWGCSQQFDTGCTERQIGGRGGGKGVQLRTEDQAEWLA